MQVFSDSPSAMVVSTATFIRLLDGRALSPAMAKSLMTDRCAGRGSPPEAASPRLFLSSTMVLPRDHAPR